MNECLDIYYIKQLARHQAKTIEASTLSEQAAFYGWPSICLIDFSKLFTASTKSTIKPHKDSTDRLPSDNWSSFAQL